MSVNGLKKGARRAIAPVLIILLLTGINPVTIAGSASHPADSYTDLQRKGLEHLSGEINENQNSFTVINDGEVPARITYVVYRTDGGADWASLPSDINLIPGQSHVLPIQRENYSGIGVYSARGVLHPIYVSGAISSESATTIAGKTEPGAPVTIIVRSEKHVFNMTADENGHFEVRIPDLEGDDHTFKVIAGDANRNEVADDPQHGGWKGYAEESRESSLIVGERNTVNIPLKFDPFDASWSTEDGVVKKLKSSVTAKTGTRKGGTKVSYSAKRLYKWENYETYNKRENIPEKFIGAEGWKIKEKSKTEWEAIWYTNISRHTIGLYDTRDAATMGFPYAPSNGTVADTNASGTLLDTNVVEVPQFKWKVAASKNYSFTYETQAEAESVRSRLGIACSGGGWWAEDSKITLIPRYKTQWKAKWTTSKRVADYGYRRVPVYGHRYVPVYGHRYVPVYGYKYVYVGCCLGQPYYKRVRYVRYYKRVRYVRYYKRVRYVRYYKRVRYVRYYRRVRVITGHHWVTVNHAKWFNSRRAASSRGRIVDSREVKYDTDYRLSYTCKYEKTFNDEAKAGLKARELGGSSSKFRTGTKYKATYTTGMRNSKTFNAKSEAGDRIGKYGKVINITDTKYLLKRAVWKIPRQTKVRHSRYVTGWPSASAQIQIASKNNFHGKVGLKPDSDGGVDVKCPKKITPHSIANVTVKVKPKQSETRSGTYNTEVLASTVSVNGKPYSESLDHELNANADTRSWTSTTFDKWITKKAQLPTPSETIPPGKGKLIVKAVEKGNESSVIGDAKITVSQGGSEFTAEESKSWDLEPGQYYITFGTQSGWKFWSLSIFRPTWGSCTLNSGALCEVKANETTKVIGHYVKETPPPDPPETTIMHVRAYRITCEGGDNSDRVEHVAHVDFKWNEGTYETPREFEVEENVEQTVTFTYPWTVSNGSPLYKSVTKTKTFNLGEEGEIALRYACEFDPPAVPVED